MKLPEACKVKLPFLRNQQNKKQLSLVPSVQRFDVIPAFPFVPDTTFAYHIFTGHPPATDQGTSSNFVNSAKQVMVPRHLTIDSLSMIISMLFLRDAHPFMDRQTLLMDTPHDVQNLSSTTPSLTPTCLCLSCIYPVNPYHLPIPHPIPYTVSFEPSLPPNWLYHHSLATQWDCPSICRRFVQIRGA